MEKESGEEIINRRLLIRCITLLLSLILVSYPAYLHAWECSVTLEGPNVVKVDQIITLHASGGPGGGSYSWSNTPNLVPNGSSAQLTGFVPSFSEYIRVIATYTSPRGKRCSDTKWIWVCTCNVTIVGPDKISVGETISLTTKSDPSGGTYAWSPLAGLVGNGSSARFTGQYPGDTVIKVDYTIPDGDACSDIHTITVSEECSVTISGPAQVAIGDGIKLSASGIPPGGAYEWSLAAGLEPIGSSARFTGRYPGDKIIKVTYTSPDGVTATCKHCVTVFGVKSITGPGCVISETTLTKDDFAIITESVGFEDLVTVSPLTFSTLSQSEEVTVTGSCGAGTTDDATTTIRVVNADVKNEKSISFEIPNFLNDVLKKICLGDKTDLSVKSNCKTCKECCGFGVATSADGSLTGNLSVSAGPFTIIGIPLPPKAKKWVAADLVNATLSGGGALAVDGSYKACEDKTLWSGGGDLTAAVAVAGEIAATVPNVIVLKGEIKGSTSITEKLRAESMDLKITTNWGGLTGLVSGEIQLMTLRLVKFQTSKTYFEKGGLLPATISLPSLMQK